MTVQLVDGNITRALAGIPEEQRGLVRERLAEAVSARDARYACVVVGVVFGMWIVEGPFFGRSPEHARMEAVESFISFGAARFVGPFPIAVLRGVFGAPAEVDRDVALRANLG
jgi:hypothetical protein